MKVVEKFVSINGESTCAGELAVFIRFKGCNISCSYCDTKWANESDCNFEEMTPQEIVDFAIGTGVRNVTLTGGEPLLQPDIKELLKMFAKHGINQDYLRTTHADVTTGVFFANQVAASGNHQPCRVRVEVETNGSVDISPFCDIYRPIFTMDYKLPSSGCEDSMRTENFLLLSADDTVKFVCSNEADLKRAGQIINEHGLVDRCNIYLSPVFEKIKPAEMVDFMIKNKMNGVRLQIQMHKVIWSPDAKGV